MRAALERIGQPVFRRRAGGFEGLFRIIIEQQVSVPSAQAILRRVDAQVDRADPQAILACGHDGLCALGLSRPKASYVIALAQAVTSGALDFDEISASSDARATDKLLALRGVGPWSAAIYLLFCEGRVDIWPLRDVALKSAYNEARMVAGADFALSQQELDLKAIEWAPHRGLAAHVLWTYYAILKGRTPT